MAISNSPVRVVIAEEHPRVRRSLRLLLDAEPWCRVVAEVSDLSMVARRVQDESPHVLVLDLHMSSGASRELIGDLHRQAPGTAIVGVTMERSPGFAARVLDMGLTGFVLKDRADAELVAATRHAARGVRYISPCVAPALEKLRATCGPGRVRTRAARAADRSPAPR
jgi:DNA-binding NarL/FixJ family response regulator